MRISTIGVYLSQSEAAILLLIAEKVLACSEQQIARKTSSEEAHDDHDAHEVAYVLKSVAEQSILNNDGQLYRWKAEMAEATRGLIDTPDELFATNPLEIPTPVVGKE